MQQQTYNNPLIPNHIPGSGLDKSDPKYTVIIKQARNEAENAMGEFYF